MKKINLKNIVWKEGDYFVAQCLNVDVSSFGKNKREALKNLQEAIELYFEGVGSPDIAEIKNPELVQQSFIYA